MIGVSPAGYAAMLGWQVRMEHDVVEEEKSG